MPEVRKLSPSDRLACPACGKPIAGQVGQVRRFLACSGISPVPVTMPSGFRRETALPEARQDSLNAAAHDREKEGTGITWPARTPVRKDFPIPTRLKCPLRMHRGTGHPKNPEGQTFYSCSRYPDCISPMAPPGHPCPRWASDQESGEGTYCPRCRRDGLILKEYSGKFHGRNLSRETVRALGEPGKAFPMVQSPAGTLERKTSGPF